MTGAGRIRFMRTGILLMNGPDGRRESEAPRPAAAFRARETIQA
jgi:hypothetical protein